jgi:hypothetical protein
MANVSFHIRPKEMINEVRKGEGDERTARDELQDDLLSDHHPLLKVGYHEVDDEITLFAGQFLDFDLVMG